MCTLQFMVPTDPAPAVRDKMVFDGLWPLTMSFEGVW